MSVVGLIAEERLKLAQLPRLGPLPILLWGPGADWLAGWLAVALALAIPLSVSADTILLGAIAVLTLTAGGGRAKLSLLGRHPAAIAALLLFALIALGMLWGERLPGDGLRYLGKYTDLLALPLLMIAFVDSGRARIALYLFIATMAAASLGTISVACGLMPDGSWLADRQWPSVIQGSIPQSVMTAFAAFFALSLAIATDQRRLRAFLVVAVLVMAVALFLLPSRTGQLLFGLLMIFLAYRLFGWRGVIYAAIGVAIVTALAAGMIPSFELRLVAAVDQTQAWLAGAVNRPDSSVGLRLDFYRYGASLFAERPLFGHGTGSFPLAYERAAATDGAVASTNAHNEYLMIAMQIGLLGLIAFVGLLAAIGREGLRQADAVERTMALGFVLAFAAGCLVNSLLLDHSEGRFFAFAAAALLAGSRQAQARR